MKRAPCGEPSKTQRPLQLASAPLRLRGKPLDQEFWRAGKPAHRVEITRIEDQTRSDHLVE
jgi:hypothetical protein